MAEAVDSYVGEPVHAHRAEALYFGDKVYVAGCIRGDNSPNG